MKRYFVLGMLLLSVLLAACAPVQARPADPNTGHPGSAHGETAQDYASLLEHLRAAGATVTPAGEVSQPFFPVTGQVIAVDGGDVQVFEFGDEQAAKAAAALVAPDGGSVGTHMLMWVATPHFYTAGKLIALYVGEDQAVLASLEAALGRAFAAGQAGGGLPPLQPAFDYDFLLASLQAADARAEASDETLAQDFFFVPGRLLLLGGEAVQVFEYADEAAMEAEAARVAPDGGAVGTSIMMWMATPHFFKSGKLLVLYVGDDAETLSMLEGVLGAQFAGGAGQPAVDALPASCEPAAADLAQFVNTEAGYCLLYPAAFEIMAADPAQVVISGPAIGEGPAPVRATLFIEMAGANGRSLAAIVDEAVNEYAALPMTRMAIALGGETAEVVEGLPGATGSWQVFALHGGRLYRLILQPVDPALPQAEADVTRLWEAVSHSFAFLP